ncbi:MAG: sodium-dependent transporter [Bacteroidaceae bacterium]|nr:sodium-dependent transporter [Bacteroidaceae bacterium]
MERGNFGSKIGAIMAAAGSAVGLGNIWRFPTECGSNGGAAFILIYLLCVFFLAMPVMVAEFVIGRSSRANAVGSYRVLAPGKPWVVSGFMGVLAGFLVLSYYSVVAGWTLDYTVESLTGTLLDKNDFAGFFGQFVASPWRPVIFLTIFLLLTHFVVAIGVEKGIERYSKIMMPILLLIIVVLAVFSMFMPNAIEGIKFLLTPDFSKVTKDVVLSAMGQAFFSLSVGMGTLATYASYFNKETRLVSSAVGVCTIDTLVAISAGFIIFPAVFSVGVSADSGPGLVFITLPYVFQEAFGSVPVLEYVFSGLFYILLLLAALTSSISMHEISTAYIHETFHLSRSRAATIVTAVCLTLGIVCSLSFGVWRHVTVAGMTFFDLFDFITAKFLMPLGGLLICTFVGWDMNKKLVASQLDSRFTPLLMILFSWVAPIGIGVIFVYGLISS